ncbi:MAG: ABC transporter ATP-binding protein [Alphaproteobacteria bacterium]|nr:ABC transporter ATP-binding protein [Alphaproteobacteria bacterium]
MIAVRDLAKSYATKHGNAGVNAVSGVSFTVAKGEFFTLLGPSGCGKSTTLQCIAGLETPDSGEIEMDGEIVFCSRRRLMVPANRRNIGMTFQSYAIWPHMTVFDNVAFPLVHSERARNDIDVRQRVMRTLDLVKLADYADRPSPHLSGGQQQRVALARALVHEPALLLLDEPLSNLDAKLRDAMRVELRQLVKTLGITTVFVTHDQLEALSMSDQIALMRAGRVVQLGPPRDVYLRPATAFAADFMGRSNLIPARVVASGAATEVETGFGILRCAPSRAAVGTQVHVVLRPQAIRPLPIRQAGPNVFEARIDALHFLGDAFEAQVRIGPVELRVMLDVYLEPGIGQSLWLELPADRCAVVEHTAEDDPDATTVAR